MWFELAPVGANYGDEAPFHFRNEVRLAAPPAAVFDLLVAPEPWSKWFPDMLSGEWVTEPPRGVGSKRSMVLKVQSVVEHFLVYEPGVRWTFRLDRATLPLTTAFVEDYQLSPTDDGGTLLVWLVHYRPRLILRPLHPILRPIFGKMFVDGCAALQKFVAEGGADAFRTGAAAKG